MKLVKNWTTRWTTMLALLLFIPQCHGGDAAGSGASFLSPIQDYFTHWFDRVSKTQAEQPHWVTPLVTVTPRLEEELRYDQFWQSRPNNQTYNSFGGGKGLELIPTERTEIILGVPAYQATHGPKPVDGWADENFLLKYRALSANETNGNYILTFFLGAAVPSGSQTYTTHETVITPSVAFGKGWGDFDIQSTLGVSAPDGREKQLGVPVAWNTAFQYHVAKYFWPEFEVNYTYWPSGDRDGINQVYLTPGLLIGRFPLWERLGLTVGVGYQIAVTARPTFYNNAILSVRLPF
jgi:hypothetical protein